MLATIWTPRRRLAGNLLPLLFLLPGLALAGVGVWKKLPVAALSGAGLAVVGGWFGLDRFGFHGSGAMRTELARLLRARGETFDATAPFVGLATPAYRSAADAHEDVGFLFIGPDALRFVSETRTLTVPRAALAKVGTAPNTHTLVGLGRWIALSGEVDGRPFRIFLEPRTAPTMRGNLRAGRELRLRLEKWAARPA